VGIAVRPEADAAERIQSRLQRALSRINGVAPTFNGLDLSSLSLNIAGSVAGFALPGQGCERWCGNAGWTRAR
jgi:hypothetical protein